GEGPRSDERDVRERRLVEARGELGDVRPEEPELDGAAGAQLDERLARSGVPELRVGAHRDLEGALLAARELERASRVVQRVEARARREDPRARGPDRDEAFDEGPHLVG